MSSRSLSPALLLVILVAGLCLADLARGEQFTVSTFGDSLTAGYPYWSGDGNGCVPPCGGYQPPLQTKLRATDRDALVRNYGKGGEGTGGGVSRIDAVITSSTPRYILLMEGTNELYWGSAHTVRDNLGYMIDKARARGVLPVLGTITPDPRYPEKNIPGANKLLRDLAQKKKVALADHYSALIGNWSNLCTSDRMHPNRTGYSIMAQTSADAMTETDQLAAPLPAKTPPLTPILMFLLDE